jgi:hypothetical protein
MCKWRITVAIFHSPLYYFQVPAFNRTQGTALSTHEAPHHSSMTVRINAMNDNNSYVDRPRFSDKVPSTCVAISTSTNVIYEGGGVKNSHAMLRHGKEGTESQSFMRANGTSCHQSLLLSKAESDENCHAPPLRFFLSKHEALCINVTSQ